MSAPNAAPQPQTQPPLLPTLLALLPVTSLPRAQANISLLSIHAEKWEVSDKIYISLESVLPSQRRTLRLRISTSTSSSTLPLNSTSSASGNSRGKTKQGQENKSGFTRGTESMSLAYVSQPLSGKEYSEINVRGVVEVDMGGLSLLEDVEDFLRTMGFSYSHEYTRQGLLFHLPLPHPSLTLHLTISRLILPSDPRDVTYPGSNLNNAKMTQEPFLVELSPARPVLGVSTRGDLGLSDVIGLMKGVAGRIDGLEWGTGRA